MNKATSKYRVGNVVNVSVSRVVVRDGVREIARSVEPCVIDHVHDYNKDYPRRPAVYVYGAKSHDGIEAGPFTDGDVR